MAKTNRVKQVKRIKALLAKGRYSPDIRKVAAKVVRKLGI